jgi:hypothetical protein
MFKIGEKVVFKPILDGNDWEDIHIKDGDIVTIHSFCNKYKESVNISECLYTKYDIECSIHKRHFRKLDHDFAKNLLARITEEVLILTE